MACRRSLKEKDKILIVIYGISSDLESLEDTIAPPTFNAGVSSFPRLLSAPRILFFIHRGDCLHPTRSQGPNVTFLLHKTQTFLSPNLPLGRIGAQTVSRPEARWWILRPPMEPLPAACGHFVGRPIKPSGAALYSTCGSPSKEGSVAHQMLLVTEKIRISPAGSSPRPPGMTIPQR